MTIPLSDPNNSSPGETSPLDARALLLLLLAIVLLGLPAFTGSCKAPEPQPTDSFPLFPESSPQAVLFVHRPLAVNHADMTTLTLLPGIGPKLAESIIQRRNERGRLKDVNDLTGIRGLGKEQLKRLMVWLSFE